MKRLRCRGVAAIEAALVLFGASVLLVNLLYCGRLALAGAALDGATSSAARYLAAVPVEDLNDSARRSAALATAQAMIDETLAGAGVTAQDLQVQYLCGGGWCSMLAPGSVPNRVTVLATLDFQDEIFGSPGQTQLSSYVEVGRDN